MAGIAGPSRWAISRFLGGGMRAEQPATSFHGWAVKGASGGLAVLGFACACGSCKPPRNRCEGARSFGRGRVCVPVSSGSCCCCCCCCVRRIESPLGVAAVTTLTRNVCAKTERGPGIKWETASEFSITSSSQACGSSWPLNGLHALQRLWTSWGHDECFDLYTLYPPGLTVIIYDGFRHTRARTLFKAQIYLNKNKNMLGISFEYPSGHSM